MKFFFFSIVPTIAHLRKNFVAVDGEIFKCLTEKKKKKGDAETPPTVAQRRGFSQKNFQKFQMPEKYKVQWRVMVTFVPKKELMIEVWLLRNFFLISKKSQISKKKKGFWGHFLPITLP